MHHQCSLQPLVGRATPAKPCKLMDSFLRWWRGGSRGERRTINTTPLPQRYELYHRKRRNEGVSLIAACCIAFNLVMGSGFWPCRRPWRGAALYYHHSRWASLSGYAHVARLGGGSHGPSRSSGGARAARPIVVAVAAIACRRPSLSDRTFEVCELCRIFCGKSWRWPTRGPSSSTTSRRCGPTRSSSPKHCPRSPHCSATRRASTTSLVLRTGKCTFIFGILAVPLSILEPGEQITFQMVMSVMRVVIVVLMASTALLSAYGVDFGPGFGPGAATSTAPFVRFAGLGRLLPATVFAQNMGARYHSWRGR